ncbi:MAG: molybdopterin biosynthesis protein [Deltaproteobacteria bacterium]|nr:molybdopterin biosynthesis protein [Deltaproteobacteria bacterium]
MKRKIYLDMKTLPEARELFLSSFDWTAIVGTEEIRTSAALGRVTAEPVFSVYSSPGYNGAAMDGIAVRADETFGASEEAPVRLVAGKQAHHVNTGQPLPEGCNAVIMIEQVHEPDPGVVEITAAAYPWQHVRRVGEDIVSRELVLAHHHRFAAADVAALLTAGVFSVRVLSRPRVAVIPTGSELVDWRDAEKAPPGPGKIIETNSVFLAGLIREAGGDPVMMDRQPDREQDIRAAVNDALESDVHMVVVNAGASAGSKDHTVHVIDALGEVLVHGVTIMPGKPTILGKVGRRPVVGSPGYPVSAWVCFDRFVRPALELMQGSQPRDRETIAVVPARLLPSKLGHEEFIRVHLGRVGDRVVATPLKRGAGTITSLTRADGIIRIPSEIEGLDEGREVQAELLGPRSAVDRTLIIVGSHDVTLDILGDHIRRRAPEVLVSASNVGSLAGLIAIREGRCHLGGTHLLDAQTGEYNVSYVRKHLQGRRVRLVTLAYRQQGLMVGPGNPESISGLADLTRGGLVFVNRQAGSGTRVLLDYHLEKLGIVPASIQGYGLEEYTHMAVAVQVLSGGAHAGLGILAAAKALGLDFVPVATERYDLCIPVDFLDDPRVAALLHTLASDRFKSTVADLGGYDVTDMGTTAWEG